MLESGCLATAETLVQIRQDITCKSASFKGVGWQILIPLNRTRVVFMVS